MDEGARLAPIFLGLQVFIWVSFAFAWLRGGHTERLAVAVLFWDYALARAVSGMPGGHDVIGLSEIVAATIFARIAFTSRRWWVLVAFAALMLCVLIFLLEWTRPDLSEYAAISARLGLWFVIHLALMAGVAERWLAGEGAVSRMRPPSRRVDARSIRVRAAGSDA